MHTVSSIGNGGSGAVLFWTKIGNGGSGAVLFWW